jgi:ATP-dependent Lhr-like helicase
LEAFLPAVQAWFRQALGEPTPPQALGWPAIQRGEHVLILSPTGSGKTLAAFLWGIDQIYRHLAASRPASPGPAVGRSGQGQASPGVLLLYISPLKALNNDIERNLRAPLSGIAQAAEQLGDPLPSMDVLVRTGDTPASMRQRMARRPPPVLITTPESLYLLLTSPMARHMFSEVRTVIVDEIHTLVGTKRGVHLAVSLERVEELSGVVPQRIGLSATQRPLEEVSRFLGGYVSSPTPAPRPVTVIDAGMVKPTDLRVVTAVEDLSALPAGSIWPAVIPHLLDLIDSHHTTLIFANSRRQAERAADRLNEVYLERRATGSAGPEALVEGGAVKAGGFFGTGAVGGPFRAHHGSVSREARYELESALKQGRLSALVGTSSLELGIDIGSVDLVVQLQSPKGVARGLQRVGRSGHMVGETSVGRIFPTHREDLLEAAATARAMVLGDVEPTYTPQNCLDVLAQQIVSMVSVEDRDVPALFDLVRRAYPYHQLSPDLFRSVLQMLSGHYPGTAFRELRPRIGWDTVHDRLAALPGSRLLALRNGGTIPDRGSFVAYLPDRKTRLGELDEEFVFETKPGDVFTLGANTWRVQEVTEDRVIVAPAPGYLPRMPFWRGDAVRRDYHLGLIYGRFRRELAERIRALPREEVLAWLQEEYCLDLHSAENAFAYVQHHLHVLGAISSDKCVIAELFSDPLGDLRLVIHSPFGARVNSPWALGLAQAFREALGTQPEAMVSDDGILFRFLETDGEPSLSLIRDMGPAEVRERLLAELPQSAVFGAQFRMNAARALLLPAVRGRQKRTPFWLQRLRAKDLLAVTRDLRDFPIVAETYRDVLRDVLDLEHLEDVLRGIQQGEIQVVTAETVVPSPVASALLFDLVAQYMYEWDQPKAERQMQALAVGRETLAQILNEASLPDLLRPEAIRDAEAHLQHLSEVTRARTPEELATLFLALGDLSAEEASARCVGAQAEDGARGEPGPEDGNLSAGHRWVHDLAAQGRLLAVEFPAGRRHILAEMAPTYQAAFCLPESGPTSAEERDEARRAVLRRVLSTHGPLTSDWLLERYPWEAAWLNEALSSLVTTGEVVAGQMSPRGEGPSSALEFCDRRNLERIHRATLSLLRREVEPVTLYAYADFLARWQHLHPAHRQAGADGLVRLLQQMRGVPVPGPAWERDILPLRLGAFDPEELDLLCESGDLVWAGSGGRDPQRARVRFFFRGEGNLFLPPEPDRAGLSPAAEAAYQLLKSEGACFFADLGEGTGLAPAELGQALVELVMAGLVTNDSLQALRQVLAFGAEVEGSQRRPLSSLDAELAAWREAGSDMRRAGSSRRSAQRSRSAARRSAAERVDRTMRPRWPGRWSLVHRLGVCGRDLPVEERLARQAQQLLHCYGIVTRQCLEDDAEGGWDWNALYPQLQRMEMRGEVRRGYFVHGLPGVQFALPEAVERLREWTRPDAPGSEDLVLLNACDPANLFGPLSSSSGEESPAGSGADPARFVRVPSNYVTLLRGRPVLLWEMGAERISAVPDLTSGALEQALELAVHHLGRSIRRLSVALWNGGPVHDSAAVPALERTGFRREALLYVWEAPQTAAGGSSIQASIARR